MCRGLNKLNFFASNVLADVGYHSEDRSFPFLVPNYFKMIWLSSLLTMSIHDEAYSTNRSRVH